MSQRLDNAHRRTDGRFSIAAVWTCPQCDAIGRLGMFYADTRDEANAIAVELEEIGFDVDIAPGFCVFEFYANRLAEASRDHFADLWKTNGSRI